MGATWQRWRLPVLIVAALALCSGCALSNFMYFLLNPEDPRQQPRLLKLAPEDKKKEVKAVLLAHSEVDIRPEFVGVDNELIDILTRKLDDTFKENKQKVTIVSPKKVREFKNNNPDWYNQTLEEIGKHFEVDYVIYLEIRSMSMYEKGMNNQLYRGRANIHVAALDMKKTDYGPLTEEYVGEYPTTQIPIQADDQTPPERFRHSFLDFVGKHLAWYFASHPPRDDFGSD